MATFEDVRRLGMQLPQATEGTFYGAMLIRLADVALDDLAEWLEDSYRRRAPAALLRRLDARPLRDG